MRFGLTVVLLCAATPALAATAPSLGMAQTFAVLGAATVTSTDRSSIVARKLPRHASLSTTQRYLEHLEIGNLSEVAGD